MAATTGLSPRIYVASLSDYNAGILHGVWIDLELADYDEVWDQIKAMLAASPEFKQFPQGGPAEEWAIHDYEGFAGLQLSEYEDIRKVVAIAEFLSEKGEAGAAWLGNDSSLDPDDWDSVFSEQYAGQWESEEDYARNVVRELGLPGVGHLGSPDRWHHDIVDELDPYLDWDALTQWALADAWSAELSDGFIVVFRMV